MKKKAISMLLAFVLLFCLSVTAFAEGDPNIDGGGGGMGEGTSENKWSPGADGVRVSIVDVETGAVMGTPIDYTNKSPSPDYHFGKKSKIHYRSGAALSPTTSAYQYVKPSAAMPTVVSSNANNNIEAVKRYFCSEAVAEMIARDFGISFETLTSGRYKLLLEPIAYMTFGGQYVAMTAHEAALYDQQLSGGLRSKMASLSHQNLPLAMFLERPDLGFTAYSGDTTGKQSNDTILAYLGIGTVTYTELDGEATPEPTSYDIEYRIDTEVITAVTLYANSEINPDSPAIVTFTVMGRSYTMSNIVIPEGESQVVWCKWTTPAAEQNITITVSTNKGYLSSNRINAKVVDLNQNPPPDPKADDRPGSPESPQTFWGGSGSFSAVSPPTKAQKTSARWTVWWAQWHVALHIKNLEIFFKLYIPSLSDMKRAILKQTIIELYNEFGIDWDTDIKKLQNTDFPTFSDLRALLEKKSNKDAELQELALLFHDLAHGSDQFLWNGHSTVETTSRCICLDTHTLQNTGDNIKRAQYFTLLSWCWEQMSKDRNERVMLICDEAYLMIDENVPQSLVFLRNVAKRARKYEAGLAIISHSVVDFLSPNIKQYGQALLDIPCYKILMGTDGKNLLETKELYSLTEAEEELLLSKKRGHALFVIGSKRLHVNFEIPLYKFDYFGKAGGR